MSAELDLACVVITGNAVFLTLGGSFLVIILANQKKVFRYRREWLAESIRTQTGVKM